MSKVASMIPGLGQMMQGAGGSDEDTSTHMRKMICISDAMTAKELDSDGKMFESVVSSQTTTSQPEFAPREPNPRVLRVARGSGTSVDMVEQYLSQHKMYQAMAKRMVRHSFFISFALC
jgi:signal recognition particle subunit SRP54